MESRPRYLVSINHEDKLRKLLEEGNSLLVRGRKDEGRKILGQAFELYDTIGYHRGLDLKVQASKRLYYQSLDGGA